MNSKSRVVQLVHSDRGLNDALQFIPGTDEGESGPNVIECGNIESNRRVLKQMASWLYDRITEYGGELYVVYLAKVRYFASDEWQGCEHDMVVGLMDNLDIQLIDLVPVINSFDDPRELFASNIDKPSSGGHPNREGYRLIADQIVERLLKNGGVK